MLREWDTKLQPYEPFSGIVPVKPPTWGETVGAAFELENDVAAVISEFNKPAFKPSNDYNLLQNVKAFGIPEDDWDYYVGTQSDEELLYRKQKIEQENRARDIYSRSGSGGIAAGMVAGMLSPTTFIPFVGTGTKGARVAKAFGYGAVAGGLQELPLQGDQLTRTAAESVLSIGASTVAQGILGAAFVYATKGEIAAIEAGIAGSNLGQAIPGSAGAQAVPAVIPSKLKAGPGIDTLSRIGPLTNTIQQTKAPVIAGVKYESQQARYMASQLGDAGLGFADNPKGISASPGGTAEMEELMYHRHLADGLVAMQRNFYDYYYDGKVPTLFPGIRSSVGGLVSNAKLTLAQFREEVTLTQWTQIKHKVPQINAAVKEINEKVFKALFEEAKLVGVYKTPEGTVDDALFGDKGYASRHYLNDQINRKFDVWLDKVGGHLEEKLNVEFAESFKKFAESRARTALKIEDLGRAPEEAKALRESFISALKTQGESEPKEVIGFRDTLSRLVRDVRKEKDPVKKAALRQLVKEHREKGMSAQGFSQKITGDAARRQIKTRLGNLLHSRAITEERYLRKISAIEKNEEMSIESISRAARQAFKFIEFIKKGSNAEIRKSIKAVKNAFAQLLEEFEESEKRLLNLSDGGAFTKIDKQDTKFDKLTALANKLNELETFDRAAWKRSVEELISETGEIAASINRRRAFRWQRLEEQAKKLDPALIPEKVKALREKLSARASRFNDRYAVRSGNTLDTDVGTASFREYAREIAGETAMKIQKVNGRTQFNDLIREKRGAEMARTLDIPSVMIQEFLEKDIERVMRIYVRTLGPDIAIARKFGSPNAQEAFEALKSERLAALEGISNVVDKSGKPLSFADQEIARKDLGKFYDSLELELNTLITRLRHERGLPQNPASYAARGASMALQINALRYMGGVVIASAADPGRPIMKYTLKRVMRDGFVPLITNFKTLKMSMREAKLAGGALDPLLHSRSQVIWDLLDEVRPSSKIEKGLNYASSHLGIIALFDYWTSAWKMFTAGLANAKLIDSIDLVLNGGGSEKEIALATEYLARKHIVGRDVETIWQQVTGGPGGGKVNGIWLPNTDAWDVSDLAVKDALRSYRTALLGEMDSTIVTPGLERPGWVDANIPYKMLGQFKSFALSSTTKTLMAGLQERDAGVFQGIMVSLSLGALSYYLWAISVGGSARTEMENAGLDKWADEAIQRSGTLAVFGEIQRIAEAIPAIRPYSSFSGGVSSRREGGDFVEAVFGPSADLANTVGQVITGIDDPTLATLHAFRKTLPYQNHTAWRQIIDKIEAASGLPERRNNND